MAAMNALDVPAVAAAAAPALEQLASDPRTAGAKLYLEMGRYLVGEAGLYLTRVTRIKRSRGSDIAICDGGMNHHLGACGHLGSVIHRNYRIFKVGESPAMAHRGPTSWSDRCARRSTRLATASSCPSCTKATCSACTAAARTA